MKQIFDRKLLPAKPSRQTIVGLLNAYSPRAFSNILGETGPSRVATSATIALGTLAAQPTEL